MIYFRVKEDGQYKLHSLPQGATVTVAANYGRRYRVEAYIHLTSRHIGLTKYFATKKEAQEALDSLMTFRLEPSDKKLFPCVEYIPEKGWVQYGY